MKTIKGLYLMRHGRTEWNRDGRLQGSKNSPLLETAPAEVLQVLSLLPMAEIDVVFASPLGRSVQTAEIMSNNYSLSYKTSPLIKECDMGFCEGMTLDEVKKKYAPFWEKRQEDKWHTKWPGGESYADVYERAELMLAQLPLEKQILIISHEMIGKCIAGSIMGWDQDYILNLKQANKQVFHIQDNSFSILTL